VIKAFVRRILRSAAGLPPIEDQLRLTTPTNHPNVNMLWETTKDIDALKLNVKMLAYELAHSMEHRLQAIPADGPRTVGLESKPVTQADVETRWFRYWCQQLGERPRYHRSLWHYAFVLQALHEAGALKPGSRLLGLDAGGQPLPSYLARLGLNVAVTGDAPLRRLDDMIDQAGFLRLVKPASAEAALQGGQFDALWSLSQVCSRGSIAKGADYAVRTMDGLKPGGAAVHIIEFNYADDERTIDDWDMVLFQRGHIEALAARLKAEGHTVSPLSFHVGHQPLDRYVDLPPFDTDRTAAFDRLWRDGWGGAHLKAAIDGFACTSFGLIARRGV
jgi:hypothetical protein